MLDETLALYAATLSCPRCGGVVDVLPAVWVTGAGRHRWTNHQKACMTCKTCSNTEWLTDSQQVDLARRIIASIPLYAKYSIVAEAMNIVRKAEALP